MPRDPAQNPTAATETAAAQPGRRRPATGAEQERRRQWGKQWGSVGREAGKAARGEQ